MTRDGEPTQEDVGRPGASATPTRSAAGRRAVGTRLTGIQAAREPKRRRAGVVARALARTPIVAILLAIAVALGVRDARAAAFDVADASWEGASELLELAKAELGAGRVVPVAVLNWDQVQPEDGVLALHPLQPMDADETTAFMKAGGRLAIVDDYGMGDDTLRRFRIERVSAPARPVTALRNKSSLPIAEPVIDSVTGQGPHPVVARVQQLVTNHPTGLKHPNLSPVLKIRAIGEPDTIIAVAGLVGKGRLFAMSDPSALINQMLRYPGNRAFAAGLVRYLVDDDGGQRHGGRLFIVANRFGEEGAFGGDTSLRKDLENHLKAIADAIAEARREGFPGWVHVALAALAAVAIALWVVRASAKPYKSPVPRYARRIPLVAQGGIAGRFAVLAAPSSPRSLALLELKSALFEAMALRLDLPADPSPDGLLRAAKIAGALDDRTLSALKDALDLMQQVESRVLANRSAPVSRAALAEAAAVVREVLDRCGAHDALHKGARRAGNNGTITEAPVSAGASTTNHHAGEIAG